MQPWVVMILIAAGGFVGQWLVSAYFFGRLEGTLVERSQNQQKDIDALKEAVFVPAATAARAGHH